MDVRFFIDALSRTPSRPARSTRRLSCCSSGPRRRRARTTEKTCKVSLTRRSVRPHPPWSSPAYVYVSVSSANHGGPTRASRPNAVLRSAPASWSGFPAISETEQLARRRGHARWPVSTAPRSSAPRFPAGPFIAAASLFDGDLLDAWILLLANVQYVGSNPAQHLRSVCAGELGALHASGLDPPRVLGDECLPDPETGALELSSLNRRRPAAAASFTVAAIDRPRHPA